MYGSTCFKCAGAGVVLTKRGHAAQAWLNAKRKMRAGDVKVGQKLKLDGVPGFSAAVVFTVTEVGYGLDGSRYQKDGEWKPYFDIRGVDAKGERAGISTFENSEVEVVLPKEQVAALRAAALDFQATLTKTGAVSKRKGVTSGT